MSEKDTPETLVELLEAIERSRDLRGLARECGLTVRELRRRLMHWRRELKTTVSASPAAESPGRRDNPGQMRARSQPGESGQGTDPADHVAEAPDHSQRASGDQDLDRTALRGLPRAESLSRAPLPSTGSPILEVYTDGASRGNPGPASVGVVFRQQNGPALCVFSAAIGRATNNQAEYQAVVAALEHCERWCAQRVHLFLDSELVVKQLRGIYRVKSPDLKPLYQKAVHLARRCREFRVSHLPRTRNTLADLLANQALDAAQGGKRAQR